MTILIVEPNSSGHRMSYVAMLGDFCESQGLDFSILTSEYAAETSRAKAFLGEMRNRVVPWSDFSPEGLELASRRLNATLVVVPDGDKLVSNRLWKRPWNGRGNLSVLVMRPSGQGQGIRRLVATVVKRSALFLARARSGNRCKIFSLSSSVSDLKSDRLWVQDPIRFDTGAACSDFFSLKTDGVVEWVAVIGAISARKNVGLVAEAAAIAAGTRADRIGLLVAGEIGEDALGEVELARERLVNGRVEMRIVNRVLSEPEIDSAIANAACIVLAHSNEGPSGIFGKALEAGTPVVTAGARSLRRDVRSVSGRASWCELDPHILSKNIEGALQKGRHEPLRTGTVEAFCRALLQRGGR